MKTWLDLEARFRTLAPSLQYCRIDAQWGAAGEYWRIAGSAQTPTTLEYELLCGVAGKFLELSFSAKKPEERAILAIGDPKIRWYSLLKQISPAFGNRSYGEQFNEDGSSGGYIYTGSISKIGEASANLCLSLHASHPILDRKSKWQWLHDNYFKALIIGGLLAILGAMLKLFIA